MPSPLLLLVVVLLALHAARVAASEVGIYTLVDGEVRVLRAASWYRLAPGVRIEDGDVVDIASGAEAQLEWTAGGTLSADGPAQLYAAAAAPGDDRKSAPAEIVIPRGWGKVVVPSGKRPLRVRLPAGALDVANAAVVVHGDAGLAEFFVESGVAKVYVPVTRGKEAPPQEAKAGEFWSRSGDRAFATAGSPPAAFVSAMPRQFRDPLPALSQRFPTAHPAPPVGRDITFVEAEPWLSGPARKSFVRRFTPRLSDPAFRAAVSAHPAAYPEWDRILHPEKYLPKPSAPSK